MGDIEFIWAKLIANFKLLNIDLSYIAAAYILLLAAGVVLGFRRKIIIYRDYTDVFLCVAVVYLPILLGFIALLLPLGIIQGEKEGTPVLSPIGWSLIIVDACIVGWIFISTCQDNRSAWRILLAFPTKIGMGILWGLAVLQSISPSGKTQQQRSQHRRGAVATLFILTPIMIRLVRHHSGIINPQALMPSRQRALVSDAEKQASQTLWDLPHERRRSERNFFDDNQS